MKERIFLTAIAALMFIPVSVSAQTVPAPDSVPAAQKTSAADCPSAAEMKSAEDKTPPGTPAQASNTESNTTADGAGKKNCPDDASKPSDKNTPLLYEAPPVKTCDDGTVPPAPKPDHVLKIAPYPADYEMEAVLVTTAGEVTCRLYAGTHPLTVLNFAALAEGTPSWTDASGSEHREPYYKDLPFAVRVKGAYVTSGLRPEGTDFVVADERCRVHAPKAGAIAMVQRHPGTASTQFMLLGRDIPEFTGMYSVFGQCAPLETIDTLTRQKAVLERVVITKK